MTAARQPKGVPVGGQFAPDTRTEPTINLSPAGERIHTAELSTTVKLRNADFDQLPAWPDTMPQPTVSFDFSDGKCETNITVDDKMMCFWDSDSDGTINDTDNGTNPWEDFDEEDQEMALEWGKCVHQRIDSSTYGIMIEASNTPAVRSIILDHALGKEPATETAGPDLTDAATRDAYLNKAAARLEAAIKEIQGVYMVSAAQELRGDFPEIDSFTLTVGYKHVEIDEAWDAGGSPIDKDTVNAATESVFRHRDEVDFSTFTDNGMINVEDAIAFRPAG
jgi:hypothetical protein